LTFEYDLDNAKLNSYAKYLNQRSSSLKISVQTHRHKHPTDCSTRTIKVMGKIEKD